MAEIGDLGTWPGAEIAAFSGSAEYFDLTGYTLLQVITKDGKLHQGFERRTKESEKTGDLVMRQLAIDVIVTIKKDQIASVQKLGSAMPAGLTTAMTRQQQLDLIQYLSSLSGEPMKE